MRFFLPLFLLLITGCGKTQTADPDTPEPENGPEWIGTIERFHPDFDQIISPGTRLEKLAKGFDWSEGPVWLPQSNSVLFSDVPQNVVYLWNEADGLSEYLRPSGFTGIYSGGRESGSNGLLLDKNGQLILCQHGDRRIARFLDDRSFETLVSDYRGKRFNSPNDAVFHSDGSLYFTDPPYGLDGLNESPLKELEFNGVFRLSPDGELVLLTKDMTFPNGIALSPDEKTIYIAQSDPNDPVVLAFNLDDSGQMTNRRVFFDARPWVGQLPGLPDGLKVDRSGNVFTTGPGGVSVLSPDGTLLGRINPGVATANCGWGEDGSTLFITADSILCRIRVNTVGFSVFEQNLPGSR